MSRSRAKDRSTTVQRCIARQDRQWLVITQDGQSAVSTEELPIGARVLVRDGTITRQAHG